MDKILKEWFFYELKKMIWRERHTDGVHLEPAPPPEVLPAERARTIFSPAAAQPSGPSEHGADNISMDHIIL